MLSSMCQRLEGAWLASSITPQVPYWAHVVYLIEYYILSFAIGFLTAVCAIDVGLVKICLSGMARGFPQGKNVSILEGTLGFVAFHVSSRASMH